MSVVSNLQKNMYLPSFFFIPNFFLRPFLAPQTYKDAEKTSFSYQVYTEVKAWTCQSIQEC